MSGFFVLSPRYQRGAMVVDPVVDMDFRSLFREKLSADDLRFVQHQGSRLHDFVATTMANATLMSSSFVRLLSRKEVSGWTSIPVTIERRNGETVTGYNLLVVTGRCGRIDRNKSEHRVVQANRRAAEYAIRTGLFFNQASWDGSDIFCPEEGSDFVFVTAKIAEFLATNRVSGITLQDSARIELTESVPVQLISKPDQDK